MKWTVVIKSIVFLGVCWCPNVVIVLSYWNVFVIMFWFLIMIMHDQQINSSNI